MTDDWTELSSNDRSPMGSLLREVRERLVEEAAAPSGRLVIGIWRRGDDLCLVALAGEMDIGNAGELRPEVERVLPPGPCRLIVELSSLAFVDSTGIRALVVLARDVRANGGTFVVVAPQSSVARVFEIVKLDQHLEIAASLEDVLGVPTAAEGGEGAEGPARGAPSHNAGKGANEDEFRRLNERLEDRARSTSATAGFQIVCECDREECNVRISITFDEYESARSGSTTFIVAPGHADPSCERVVSSTEGYEIVEKFGDAGLVAQLDDPRDD
jgi:anti-anti-sigma factor